mgnify:CR=1 FL=1
MRLSACGGGGGIPTTATNSSNSQTDLTPSEVTLIGSASMTIELGTAFIERSIDQNVVQSTMEVDYVRV